MGPNQGLPTGRHTRPARVYAVIHLALTTVQSFAKPRDLTLLPNILPPPYQKPYTLILELKDVLIHTGYDVMV